MNDTTKTQGFRVLVIDDEPFFGRLIKEQIQSGSISSVSTCTSGEEGLRQFKATPNGFDVIIIDLLLENKSGISILEAIRAEDSPRRDIPVIIISGEPLAERVIKARDAGMHEFLTKPFSRQRIMEAIRRACYAPRPFVVSEVYVGPDRRFRQAPFKGEDQRNDDA